MTADICLQLPTLPRLSVVMADSYLLTPNRRKQSCSTMEEEARVSTEPARSYSALC